MPQELKRLAEEYIEAQRGWDLRESLYPRTAHVALDKLSQARSALLAALIPERVVALCKFVEVTDTHPEIRYKLDDCAAARDDITAAFEHQKQESE